MDGISIERAASSDLTRSLAGEACAIAYQALPEPVREVARQCVLDYLGCAIAGARDPLVGMLLDEVAEAGGTAQASVVGYSSRLPALSAALVNGAAGHALDYDDVNIAMPGHPSVAVLPGLLALAELRGSSGREVLAAFVAGYETACHIGAVLSPGHYAQGFHSTATIGSFGAAAACARLLGLDAETIATALGIAGTQAAGLKSQFGTMCKPFHAGKAAQNGLLAARLAARGFSSRTDLIECVQGFAATHGPDFSPEAARGARRRVLPPRQSLQIPCRVLFHACADRMRPRAAPSAWADPRQHRRRHLVHRREHRPRLQHRCPGRRLAEQIQPAPDRGDGVGGDRHREPQRLWRSDRAGPRLGAVARAGHDRFSAELAADCCGDRSRASRRQPGSSTPRFRAFPRPTLPSKAGASPPSSTAWSSRCSVRRALANCAKRSPASTALPISALSPGLPQVEATRSFARPRNRDITLASQTPATPCGRPKLVVDTFLSDAYLRRALFGVRPKRQKFNSKRIMGPRSKNAPAEPPSRLIATRLPGHPPRVTRRGPLAGPAIRLP